MTVKLNIFLSDFDRPVVLTTNLENAFELEDLLDRLKDCIGASKGVSIKTDTDIFLSSGRKIVAINVQMVNKPIENINFDDIDKETDETQIIIEDESEEENEVEIEYFENQEEPTDYSLENNSIVISEIEESDEEVEVDDEPKKKRGRKKKEDDEVKETE